LKHEGHEEGNTKGARDTKDTKAFYFVSSVVNNNQGG